MSNKTMAHNEAAIPISAIRLLPSKGFSKLTNVTLYTISSKASTININVSVLFISLMIFRYLQV